jgi:hypothetical protein
MKLLIMQFSPTSYYFIPRLSKYSPQHPLLKYIRFSLHHRETNFTHTYKTRQQMLLIIFTFNCKHHYQKPSSLSEEGQWERSC